MTRNKTVFVVSLLIMGCSPGRLASAQNTTPLVGTTWIIQTITDQQPGIQVFLKLDEEDRLTGFAGCNRFFANYILDEDHLEFGLVGSTKMMCPEMETETLMFTAIDQTRYYIIENDELILLNEKKEPLATGSAQVVDQ
jgi:heat shock protein HslJ